MSNNIARLSHKQILQLARKSIIPPLLPQLHKGQCGRVAVIGGCEDYTGAPFFSANAAALFGCDLTHVVCELNAGTVIKSYSPNLMVHPYLRDSSSGPAKSTMDKVKGLIDRIHVVVIGPGLGRDPVMLNTVVEIVEYIATEHKGEIPIVLDADGLYLISNEQYSGRMQELLGRFPAGRVVITPNVVEFKRIKDVLGAEDGDKVSQQLGCVVVQKGQQDKIFYGGSVLENNVEGSNKRVGGQGDTLTGVIATMLAYSRATYDFGVWDPPTDEKNKLDWCSLALISCYVGSTVTRECSKLAFKQCGRAMQTTDVNFRVGEVYAKLFD